MKRILVILMALVCIVPMVYLSGCRQDEFMDQRDIERFLPVQTLGFDLCGEGMTVTLSTGGMLNNNPPMVITGTASGIEAALTRLQDFSPRDSLFYDHVQYIMCGEAMAREGVAPVLQWVERSPFMRMGTQVFLVKGDADSAISSASGEMADITERLTSLDREAAARGQHIFTLLDIASSLADRGTALCMAVESVPSENTVADAKGSSPGNAIIPAGYGILLEGKLIDWLPMGEGVGAMLFYRPPTGTNIPLDGVTLELLRGSAHAKGQWAEDGTLTGIVVTAQVSAGIREQAPELSPPLSQLEDALGQTVALWLESVVSRSQRLGCDFLLLEEQILTTPWQVSSYGGESWPRTFSTLPVTVEVQADIRRGYNRTD